MREARDRSGAESVLPYCYGGSNGLLTQDTTDAPALPSLRHVAPGPDLCAAPTGAANQALYGKMPSVTYQRLRARGVVIILWGVNPSATGIHLVPYVRDAQSRGRHAGRHRSADDAAGADRRIFTSRSGPARTWPSRWRCIAILFVNGLADEAFLREHTRGADRLRERAEPWTIERAAELAGIEPAALEQVARLYAERSPALIRCGWGLERNRNGGNAAMAVLSLPAVGGKFGVRGGGYSMSNSASWNIDASWIDTNEPATRLVNMNHLGRVPDRVSRSAGQGALRLQLQPRRDRPRSAPHRPGDSSARTCSRSCSSR